MFWLRLFKADYLNRNMEFPGGNIKIEWMHIHLRWSFQVAFATYIVPILNDNFFSMKSTDFTDSLGRFFPFHLLFLKIT